MPKFTEIALVGAYWQMGETLLCLLRLICMTSIPGYCIHSDKTGTSFHFLFFYPKNTQKGNSSQTLITFNLNIFKTTLQIPTRFCTTIKLISKMANGKAVELSSEHLKNSRPIVICVLTKLFNLFIMYRHIPVSIGCSYTVPIPKRDGHCRALPLDDFRGISISPVISKLFEMAILNRFCVFHNI